MLSTDYEKTLLKLKNSNVKLYKSFHYNEYYKSSLAPEIIEKIAIYLNKHCYTIELERLHKRIIVDLKSLSIANILKDDLIELISTTICKYYDRCIAEKFFFDELDMTVDAYVSICKLNKINGNIPTWSSYHYLMSLGTRTCPYCNRQYITPSYNSYNRIRGDIDHFYSKSKVPFFSMSLYNLIPCCKGCNSSLKHNREFTNDTHLNPYDGGFEELVKFGFERHIGQKKEINILMNHHTANNELLTKINGNIKVFKIKTLYSYHDKDIESLLEKVTKNTDCFRDDYNDFLKTINRK